jgi:VWFA-related protein
MRYPRLRSLLLGAFILTLATGVHTQQQQPAPAAPSDAEAAADEAQDQPPIFRTGINFIRVDVIVTDDDGNPVRDLEAADFQVFEDGEPQTIESFQLVEIGAVPAPDAEPAREIINAYDEEREAQRTDTRIFVVFFDDYHVRWENGVRAGRALAEFLRTNLNPTDMVGIMHPLTPLSAVRVTRNHAAVIEAAENFYGRKFDYDPANMFEQRYAHYPTEIVERLRNEVSLSALEGLMIRLGALREGRKNVLLISEGYSNYVPPEHRSQNAEMFGAPPVQVDPRMERFEETAQFFSDQGLSFDLRDVYSTANRFNTTIYALDPRGLAVSEYDVSQRSVGRRTDDRMLRSTRDTLYVLASETDGRTILNTNNLQPGLRQMVRDSSAYYLLGYNSSRSPTDGKYHEIDVRVERDDTDVRHRQGYWALTERDVERALTTTAFEPPKAVDTALASLAQPRRGGRPVRTWIGTAKGDNGRTRVTFLWEPAAQARRGGEAPARVLLTALSDAGGPSYRGRVPEGESRAGRGTNRRGAASDSAPAEARVEFEAEPGTLQLSLAVEDEAGEVIDRDRREIEIPDFTGTELVLSTPSFLRARNHLEWQAIVDDWEAAPTAVREFRRTERVLIRFEAYAPGTERPDIKARLLNRGGELIHPLDVQQADEGRPYQVDLRPIHLPPGDYVVELAASSPTGDVTQLIAFRLRS